MQVFTHGLVNDLGKENKERIFTRELLDKLGQI
jgi:HD-like signal output (HDOD) protein